MADTIDYGHFTAIRVSEVLRTRSMTPAEREFLLSDTPTLPGARDKRVHLEAMNDHDLMVTAREEWAQFNDGNGS